MKHDVNKSKNNVKNKISNEVKCNLPKLQLKLIKNLKGINNIVNKFIYIPDLVGGGDPEVLRVLNVNIQNLDGLLISENIKYNLIGFSFDKAMKLKFEYLFEDEDSGLCSKAWLIEDLEGWRVKKIDSYWSLY
jgi:hypothetical protein